MHRTLLLAIVIPLTAGCIEADHMDDGLGPFEPTDVSMAVPETASYPGLLVAGNVNGRTHDLVLSAHAENNGPRTYKVQHGCDDPWTEELLRDGQRLTFRQPVVHCLAFSLADFPPGQSVSTVASWNGTLWDDQEGYVRAPPGDYVWSMQFVAYQQNGNELKRFDLDFPITVRG